MSRECRCAWVRARLPPCQPEPAFLLSTFPAVTRTLHTLHRGAASSQLTPTFLLHPIDPHVLACGGAGLTLARAPTRSYLVVPAAIAVRMAGWEFPSAPRGGASLARSGMHPAAKGVGVKGGLEWPQGEAYLAASMMGCHDLPGVFP